MLQDGQFAALRNKNLYTYKYFNDFVYYQNIQFDLNKMFKIAQMTIFEALTLIKQLKWE